jgi:hypothetical protein
VLLKIFKKTKICLVSCFSFFFCLMHLDSPLNSHVSFMNFNLLHLGMILICMRWSFVQWTCSCGYLKLKLMWYVLPMLNLLCTFKLIFFWVTI